MNQARWNGRALIGVLRKSRTRCRLLLLSVCLVSLARKKYAANKICSEKCFCRLQRPYLVQRRRPVACAFGSKVSRSDRGSGIAHGREGNPRAQRRKECWKYEDSAPAPGTVQEVPTHSGRGSATIR